MPPLFSLILSIVATLGVMLLIVSWLLSELIVRRRKPDPPCLPDAFGLPFEAVTFPSRDGVRLAGRLIGKRDGRPVVVFCAGMFGSMDGDTHFAPVFFEAGFDVLQFDWRAHGLSGGARGTLGVREMLDVQGAVDFLQARGVQQIGLMGFSFGAAVALRAAAIDQRVTCIICDGSPTSVQRAFEGYLRERGIGARYSAPILGLALRLVETRLGLRLSESDPVPSVASIGPRPVFFIHGERDMLVPPSEQDRLYAACGEPKTLWRIEGAGHRQGYELEPEKYRRRVIGFFSQHLSM
jgi:fermentation-respiration switch protein FrsA (DUF1100 family)